MADAHGEYVDIDSKKLKVQRHCKFQWNDEHVTFVEIRLIVQT